MIEGQGVEIKTHFNIHEMADIDECALYGCTTTAPGKVNGTCSTHVTALNNRTCTCGPDVWGSKFSGTVNITGSLPFAGCTVSTN